MCSVPDRDPSSIQLSMEIIFDVILPSNYPTNKPTWAKKKEAILKKQTAHFPEETRNVIIPFLSLCT